jgi:dUTP pyrophosphatase
LTAYSHEYDRGADYYVVDLGTSICLPSGYWAQLHGRSSLAKLGWRVANGTGIIDNGYRGPLKALLEKRHDKAKPLKDGEKYVQLIILPDPYIALKPGKVSKTTDRGEGGFGSTTKKKVADEEEEDEEKPKKKVSAKKKAVAEEADDEEEEKPKKKSSTKKKAVAEEADDEEEEKPKKKSSTKKKADDEEEPKKKSSTKKKADDEEPPKKASRAKKSAPPVSDEE